VQHQALCLRIVFKSFSISWCLELSLVAPRYEAHVTDENVPLDVKIEQRGRCLYVVMEEKDGLPKYVGCGV
jgi:hypothetical protein